MGAREYNYTRGNTALVPERKPQYDKNKKQKIKEELRAIRYVGSKSSPNTDKLNSGVGSSE